MKKLFSFILVALLPMVASAYFYDSITGYDAMIDGIGYKFSGNNATVSYQWHEVYEGGEGYYSEYSGDIVIPESVTYNGKTYKVTGIGDNAFDGCGSLTSATLPNTITGIGNSAFLGCSSLTSVNLPNAVTRIGYYAFQGCSKLASVNIPEGVTSVNFGSTLRLKKPM